MAILLGAILIIFVLVVTVLFVRHYFWRGRLKNVNNKHVVITGGSSGIGKCVAITAARHGAHVTIIARDIQRLEAARNEIIHACKNKDVQKVEYLSIDIGEDYEAVEKALSDIERTMGPIYMLVNCAGTAICDKIEDTKVADIKKMINLNFLGSYYCTKAVVQRMKAAQEGIIVLTSSQAALLGIFGYSAYCSTKFALRGLAESISMELAPYNISVTLCLPPDTDTPGFAIEELTKPLETKLISETTSLVSPGVVADKLFRDALAGKFFSTVGVEGFILTVLCSGMSPFSSIVELVVQSMLSGLFRLISACYIIHFQKIIRNCIKTRDKNKKSE
ncbi:PREDICTED: 3-ketodihydrosphingosine reductase [Dufourea novaeangliae]|uniref:3-dehydrosphinganine reductase n=1 Tax=Dufourea novaeangliae TaxID=178035 RepID=A0A154PFB3_DUFNO|nr:PREDICTED: 3-ketodihydrosphingosine reductase [Dufourea novaeangliae]XP_015432008.1 PREDICTED: 3-ketodihydrosphingosine reductase [Dufourea novaeangliae]KZC10134.1 3-ketodihydrosphingosine reductase [Dufourea novaeangliae]